jgi:hypothetical protein
VPAQLAEDGGRGVGGETDGPVDVEPVDRLHQPEAGDLHEIVGGLTAVGVPVGQRAGKRQHLLGEDRSGLLVPPLVPCGEEFAFPGCGSGRVGAVRHRPRTTMPIVPSHQSPANASGSIRIPA